MAGLRSREPALDDTIDLVNPWHSHCISGNDHNGKVRGDLCESFDHLVLGIRKFESETVGTFAVLMFALVETSDEYHRVSILCHGHSISDKLLLRPALREVLTGHDTIIIAGDISYITTFVNNFSLAVNCSEDSFERSGLMLDLQRRRAAAYGHHLDGILSDHSDLLYRSQIHRKHIVVILEKHDALSGDSARRIIMFRRVERT